MYCKKCGAHVSREDSFCTRCGNPLSGGKAPEADWDEEESTESEGLSGSEKRLIVEAVLAVISAAVLIYLMYKYPYLLSGILQELYIR